MRIEALQKHCIALEKGEEQVVFINMRIKALWECQDQDEEVSAKHIADTERFQPASRDPIPPLAREPGELIQLDEEMIEDLMIPRLIGENNASIAKETFVRDEQDNDVDDLIAM